MPKEKKPEQKGSGISRRDFFRSGAAAGAVSTALASGKNAEAADDASWVEVLGPEAVEIHLNVNGETRRLKVEPRVTLLDALRERLDIVGPKKVCDRATCGACSVLLDGKIAYACSILAIEAQGMRIETTEALGSVEKLHPIQKAFIENDAQQCGFCTPGFVLASKAFLDKNPNPSAEDIEKGLGGNLCRCGTYVGVRQAIMDAAGKGGSDA